MLRTRIASTARLARVHSYCTVSPLPTIVSRTVCPLHSTRPAYAPFCTTSRTLQQHNSDLNQNANASSKVKSNKQKQTKTAKNAASRTGDASAPLGVTTTHGPEAYKALREQELKEAGLIDPTTGYFRYPNTYYPTLSISEFISKYSSLAPGEKSTEESICLTGRIHSKREASSKLFFYDFVGSEPRPARSSSAASSTAESSATPAPAASTDASALTDFTPFSPKVQIMATLTAFTPSPVTDPAHISPLNASPEAMRANFTRLHRLLRRGDVLWVKGRAQKTKTGELSIVPSELQLLAPCWREIPTKLNEPNTRFRNRHLDMLVNRSTVTPFYLRSQVLSTLRAFLIGQGFHEVETPILWTAHGGANAKPFITSSTAMGESQGLNLFMRIAPELFLKQLVIGGMERVFEVSKVFRNEGMDATHNPEFTTVELYQAYTDYRGMMKLTEDLLLQIVRATHATRTSTAGSSTAASPAGASPPSSFSPSQLPMLNRFTNEAVLLDFDKPFAKIDIMQGLAAEFGVNESELPDPNNDASREWYLEQCDRRNIHVPFPHTMPRILDKLIGALLEPRCIEPTFLLHHPLCMSPLARLHPTRPGLTERFELFINGSEYANAYSELNDPQDQLARMQEQARQGEEGDEEAQPVDAQFCTALEYGLAPTGGWGLGVDRLIMLLAGTPHIRDVLLFPLMKPMNQPQTAAVAAVNAEPLKSKQ